MERRRRHYAETREGPVGRLLGCPLIGLVDWQAKQAGKVFQPALLDGLSRRHAALRLIGSQMFECVSHASLFLSACTVA